MHGADDTSNFKFSISKWFRLSNAEPDTIQMLSSTSEWSASSTGVLVGIDDRASQSRSRTLRCSINRGVAGQSVISDLGVDNDYPDSDNTWIHAVWTYDQSLANANLKLYVDGSYVRSVSKSVHTPTVADPVGTLTMGESPAGALDMTGDIDEVKIYDRVLSSGEITALYNSGDKYTSNGYWHSPTITPNDEVLQILNFTLNNSWPTVAIDNINIHYDSNDSVLSTCATDQTFNGTTTLYEASFTGDGWNCTRDEAIYFNVTLKGDGDNTPALQELEYYLGNWTSPDTTAPQINSVTDTPDPQYFNGTVNITANLTDAVGVTVYFINVTYPGGATTNTIMTVGAGDLYHNVTNYPKAGNHTYFIWVEDAAGNGNKSATYWFIILPDDAGIGGGGGPGAESTLDALFTWRQIGRTVIFNYTGDAARYYRWSFGDGTGSEDYEPTHRYADYGIYTVKLEVELAIGTKAYYELEIDLDPTLVDTNEDIINFLGFQFPAIMIIFSAAVGLFLVEDGHNPIVNYTNLSKDNVKTLLILWFLLGLGLMTGAIDGAVTSIFGG